MAHHAPTGGLGWPDGAWHTGVSTTGRGRSLVGRAPPLHGGGQEFESPRLHQLWDWPIREGDTHSVRGNRRQRLKPGLRASSLDRSRWRPVLFCQFRWGPPPASRWPATKPGTGEQRKQRTGRTLRTEEREVLHQAVPALWRGCGGQFILASLNVGQATKGARWMPWYHGPKKGVARLR